MRPVWLGDNFCNCTLDNETLVTKLSAFKAEIKGLLSIISSKDELFDQAYGRWKIERQALKEELKTVKNERDTLRNRIANLELRIKTESELDEKGLLKDSS